MVTRKRDRIPLQRFVAFESEAERFAIFRRLAGHSWRALRRPRSAGHKARGNPTHQRPSWTKERAAISSTMEGEFGARLLDGDARRRSLTVSKPIPAKRCAGIES
jgi:hypothetical protein